MKNYIITILCVATCLIGFSQSKNFIDQPFLETTAKVDSLVEPDRLYLSILIQEKEDRDRTSVEKQEREMATALEALGIDLKKQLKIEDLASNYKKYFLRKKSVLKSKSEVWRPRGSASATYLNWYFFFSCFIFSFSEDWINCSQFCLGPESV